MSEELVPRTAIDGVGPLPLCGVKIAGTVEPRSLARGERHPAQAEVSPIVADDHHTLSRRNTKHGVVLILDPGGRGEGEPGDLIAPNHAMATYAKAELVAGVRIRARVVRQLVSTHEQRRAMALAVRWAAAVVRVAVEKEPGAFGALVPIPLPLEIDGSIL